MLIGNEKTSLFSSHAAKAWCAALTRIDGLPALQNSQQTMQINGKEIFHHQREIKLAKP